MHKGADIAFMFIKLFKSINFLGRQAEYSQYTCYKKTPSNCWDKVLSCLGFGTVPNRCGTSILTLIINYALWRLQIIKHQYASVLLNIKLAAKPTELNFAYCRLMRKLKQYCTLIKVSGIAGIEIGKLSLLSTLGNRKGQAD